MLRGWDDHSGPFPARERVCFWAFCPALPFVSHHLGCILAESPPRLTPILRKLREALLLNQSGGLPQGLFQPWGFRALVTTVWGVWVPPQSGALSKPRAKGQGGRPLSPQHSGRERGFSSPPLTPFSWTCPSFVMGSGCLQSEPSTQPLRKASSGKWLVSPRPRLTDSAAVSPVHPCFPPHPYDNS